MWAIRLRNEKDLLVDNKQKEAISVMWDNYIKNKINSKFSINGAEYLASEIRFIEKSQSSEKRILSGTEMVNNATKEYNEEIARFIKLPTAEKVTQRRQFMDLAFTVISGNKIPEANKQKVKEILLDFYSKNPKRMYPDMMPFKNLMEYSLEVKQTDAGLKRDEIPKINTLMMGMGFLRGMLNDDLIRVAEMK